MRFLKRPIFFIIVFLIAFPFAGFAANVNFEFLLNPVAPPGGGGGGGGGGGYTGPSTNSNANLPVTSNAITGWTSAFAYVEVVTPTQVLATEISGADGSFSFAPQTLSNTTATIRSTDLYGGLYVSSPPLSLGSGANTGIVLPPSISFLYPTGNFNRGEPITGKGRVVPGATVSMTINAGNGIVKSVMPPVDAEGNFPLNFDTASFSAGPFTLQVSLIFMGKTETSFFNGTVGKNVLPTPPQSVGCDGAADLNCDKSVDIQDVSILLFYFGKKDFPKQYDLNNDGKIDLIDFSSMLYYFAGQINATLVAATVDTTGDTTPPTVTLDVGKNLDGSWLAAFNASDQEDDVKSVQISLDNGKNWRPAASPYSLGKNPPTSVMVRAADDAGNVGQAKYAAPTPWQTVLAFALSIIALTAIIFFLIYLARKKYA